MVIQVGDVHVARRIHRHSNGLIELGRRRRTAITAEPRNTGARDRHDGPVRGDPAYPVALNFSDVHVPRQIHGHANRPIELGRRRRTAIAAVTLDAVARDRRYRPVRGDPPNPVIGLIGDIHVARRIHRHVRGLSEFSRRGRAAIAPVTEFARARERLDGPVQGNPPDPVVLALGDVHVPRRVHRHADGPIKLGLRGRTAVAPVTVNPRAGQRADRAGFAGK